MHLRLKRILSKVISVLLVVSMSFAAFPTAAYAKKFSDVPKGHWAYGVVQRAVKLGLMSGYKNGAFGAGDSITRAQVAVVLWNLAGQPKPGAKAKKFSDVSGGAYYATAVRWASSVGVVSGYKGGTFGPADKVTREQLAVMLNNYAKNLAGRDAQVPEAAFTPMLDSKKVSKFARPAIAWCFARGILTGSKGKINPKGNATRAEASKMFVFFYDELHGESHAPQEIYLPHEYCGTYTIKNVAGPIPENVGGRDVPEGTVMSEQTLHIYSIGENYVYFEYTYYDRNMAHPISTGEVGEVAYDGIAWFSYEGTNGNGVKNGETGHGTLQFESGTVYLSISADTYAQGFSCATNGVLTMKKGTTTRTV